MIQLVNDGELSIKDFKESYLAFKNHISHGDCIKFGHSLDCYIESLYKKENIEI